mgnify:CR=1 FL=1
MTMEKANSCVNRLVAEGRLGELACVVVDEAHMVADPTRWGGEEGVAMGVGVWGL